MATLKDVAKEAGLTVTTVSRILNNRGYISDEARQKVADAMKKLNYRPNEVARALQNKSSNLIGLIVPHILQKPSAMWKMKPIKRDIKFYCVIPSAWMRENGNI